MIFGNICTGIDAASVAWNVLGWKASFFSEIEPFPCSLLKHHYSAVPNHGDMTNFSDWPDHAIDLLCGGTPCQSFSVAGLRGGLDDPRGNLMLTFGAIAAKYRPRWLVWENVPGVLSSNGGRDFGAFLGLLGFLGYGFAYRVLDAQYFGLAQRRKRVFVVACLGDWRAAAAVLFEREGLRGDPAPSRQTRQIVAALTANGVGTCGADDNQGQAGHLIASTGDISHCLNAGGMGRQDFETETLIAHAFDARQSDVIQYGDKTGPLDTCGSSIGVLAFQDRFRGDDGRGYDRPPPMSVGQIGTLETVKQWNVATGQAVRRLTPRECERLQGFPDDYTLVPMRNKNGKANGKWSKDGPRYKALGNSWAVPVVRWIGRRIEMVDAIKPAIAKAAA